MNLPIFEEVLRAIVANSDKKTFSCLIRDCRDALGLKLFKAAEFAGIQKDRFNNLEIGFFKLMPDKEELEALSRLYGIDRDLLYKKAYEHVRKYSKEPTTEDTPSRHLSRYERRDDWLVLGDAAWKKQQDALRPDMDDQKP